MKDRLNSPCENDGGIYLAYDKETSCSIDAVSNKKEGCVDVECSYLKSYPMSNGHSVTTDERRIGSDLFFAVADGSVEMVKALLLAGVHPDVRDYEQRCPLHVAAGLGKSIGCVQALIDHRADVNAVDCWGQTPLAQAARGGHPLIEKLLEKSGAKQQKINLQKQALQEKWEVNRSDVQVGKELSRTLKSVVHRATWNGIDVVAKFALARSDGAALSGEAEEELMHEISVLATIRHPDLVMFLGCCLQESPIMFISQFMPGGDLERYYASKRSDAGQPRCPPLKVVNRWSRSILRALNFLHHCSQPIIHRDLKPLNIMLTDVLEVKVTDFGISKATCKYTRGLSKFEQSDSYFMTGGVGSWRYMAPEVARHQVYTEKVDIYSFGLVLYFMSSGRQPFHEYDNAEKILDDYAKGDEPRPRLNECPPVFRPIMEAAWHPRPSDRLEAGELIELLVEKFGNNSNCACTAM
mmetsp:Transcript_120854/g.188812  ORF Transcript_120854/g.188812 Transcript_120854/m.188812 type:complete len:467 (+) Transcript_120854:62-1462(+)